ncbi:hypothetical protein MMC18_009436 [Xylographa bjoerkii]|nr:hypothetical protein [Xylographa bjoerkii]
MASDAVSSLIGDGTYLTAAESFNYANLNYPYNFQAYEQGARHLNCFPGQSGCDVEIEGGYNPYVSLPQQLRDLDPTWASCIIAPDVGSWDPPYALQPIEGTLTPPSPIYTVGPVAGATPISPLAQSTLVSVPIPTAADGQPQPKPWTPVPVPSPTPSKSPVPDSPSADPPMNADPSANVNPPLENPSSSPSPQQTPSDSSPTNPATAQEPTSTPAPQPPPAGPPIIIFHGNPITADSTSAYTIGTQTLVPGGLAITVSSTVLSLAPSATAIAIGGATIPLQFPSSSAPFVITIENTAYTANSASAFTLGTQTLIPGGPAITEAGTMLSLAPSATAIVIGDIAIPLQPSPPPAPQITIGNSIYTANSASAFVIGTQTLLPSGPALTISGTTYSLFPSATALLFDSSTISIAALLVGTSTTLFTLFPGLFTVGNAIYPGTTNAAGALVLSGQTLLPGSAVTLAGTVVSLDAAGTAVVVGGTRTVPVAESGSGVGTVVTSQFGGGYTGLGGVVVSEYGATPTGGSECAVGGSTGAGIGIQRGSGMGATATASGIGTFAGGVGRRGVRCEWVWAAVGVGLVVGGGLGGL